MFSSDCFFPPQYTVLTCSGLLSSLALKILVIGSLTPPTVFLLAQGYS